VSNVGADRNWTGSDFDQANWYVFGRLAWDPGLSAREIAEEWVRMTFSNDAAFVGPVVAMMMGSREAVVDYMTPLGLAHLMASGHHYGPGAWQGGGTRADWTPPYFHRADADGIGFDRGTGGSNAVSQYAPPLAALFNDPRTHTREIPAVVSPSALGPPHGIRVQRYGMNWSCITRAAGNRCSKCAIPGPVCSLRGRRTLLPRRGISCDPDKEARWWRDATLAYFQSISGLPFPPGTPPPSTRSTSTRRCPFPMRPAIRVGLRRRSPMNPH
jgi:alpha-glucuronidase